MHDHLGLAGVGAHVSAGALDDALTLVESVVSLDGESLALSDAVELSVDELADEPDGPGEIGAHTGGSVTDGGGTGGVLALDDVGGDELVVGADDVGCGLGTEPDEGAFVGCGGNGPDGAERGGPGSTGGGGWWPPGRGGTTLGAPDAGADCAGSTGTMRPGTPTA